MLQGGKKMIFKYWHFLKMKYYSRLTKDARDPQLRNTTAMSLTNK